MAAAPTDGGIARAYHTITTVSSVWELDIFADLQDAISASCGQTGDKDIDRRRWHLEAAYLLDIIPPLLPDCMVLDYGCGVGRISKPLIERYGCAVIGVDINKQMLMHARKYVQSSRFVPVSFGKLPPKHFDLVLAVWVLQHCGTSLPSVIERIKATLKPDGALFIVHEDGQLSDDIRVRMMDYFGLPERTGQLDPEIVGQVLSEISWWGLYRK